MLQYIQIKLQYSTVYLSYSIGVYQYIYVISLTFILSNFLLISISICTLCPEVEVRVVCLESGGALSSVVAD